jgi:2-C-methyl-D-erythritol 4-phosphate cytidylyltransferase
MQVGVVVPAAGTSTRPGLGCKAMVQLHGRSSLARVVELFSSLDEVDRIVVAASEAQIEAARREVRAAAPRREVIVCVGGDSRQASVRAALAALGQCDYVLVHDATRPMVSAALVRRVLAAAAQAGAAMPGVMPGEAVKRVGGGRLLESIPRGRLMLAQTPQAFRRQPLERAHFEAADAGLVGEDDAQLVAAAGQEVAVVEGEATNVKLTQPEDVELLEGLVRAAEARRVAAASPPAGAPTGVVPQERSEPGPDRPGSPRPLGAPDEPAPRQ